MISRQAANGDRELESLGLLEACGHKGCPVCHLIHEADRKYFVHLLYEDVNDPVVRSSIRGSLGYGRLHSNILLESGSPLGIAIIYQDLFLAVANSLEDSGGAPRRRSECPACISRRKMERLLCEKIAVAAPSGELHSALRASDGLCLRHLYIVKDGLPDDNRRRGLVGRGLQTLREFSSRLRAYLRSPDQAVRDETRLREVRELCQEVFEYVGGGHR